MKLNRKGKELRNHRILIKEHMFFNFILFYLMFTSLIELYCKAGGIGDLIKWGGVLMRTKTQFIIPISIQSFRFKSRGARALYVFR